MSDQSQNPEPKAGETPTELTVAAEPAAGDAVPPVPSAAASSEPVPAPLPTPTSEPVAAAPSSESVAPSATPPTSGSVASSAAAPSSESMASPAAAPSSEPVAPPPPPPTPDWAPASARTGGDASPSRFDERPELAVGAAFAGGLILALILKRLGR